MDPRNSKLQAAGVLAIAAAEFSMAFLTSRMARGSPAQAREIKPRAQSRFCRGDFQGQAAGWPGVRIQRPVRSHSIVPSHRNTRRLARPAQASDPSASDKTILNGEEAGHECFPLGLSPPQLQSKCCAPAAYFKPANRCLPSLARGSSCDSGTSFSASLSR
jgi:hypothetical protein